jgi:hypothetical protein
MTSGNGSSSFDVVVIGASQAGLAPPAITWLGVA